MYEPTPYQGPHFVTANGIQLCYDAFGDPANPPLLMISGLGMQLTGWDEEVCTMLAERGYWVIRYDNRDVGLSTKFENAGMPNMLAALQGGDVNAPYLLQDMAADAEGLLDALDVDSAHVLGASMGGMIAQSVAIHYPERVRTLISIMSTTGAADLPQPKPEVAMMLLAPAAKTLAEHVENSLAWAHVLNGPTFPVDEPRAREQAIANYERSYYPPGTGRQLAAIFASGSRREALRSLAVPTLVIHGQADPLIPVEGGIDTAEAIPNAKLLLIEGLGHALPEATWPEVVEAIAKHAQ
ncbi:MAG: alpha/beta hydrolase [Chloroflexi bacterium]|nr:alpha/beta hydrolase [Chloroflexota bacterium]MBP7045318.1 alpha/beta hydrolase [Chloroflexota bacterium]